MFPLEERIWGEWMRGWLFTLSTLCACELVISPGNVAPPGAAADAGACVSKGCEAQGKTCGFADDSCGTNLFCGSCPAGKECGDDNVCVAACTGAESDLELCQKASATCGTLHATDRCGKARNVPCGPGCASGLVCGAARPSACACNATSCPAGQRCEPASGICVSGCTLSSQCPTGGRCDANGLCVCDAPTHLCGAACVPNDIAACGNTCTACASDPHGTAGCDGTSCTLFCDSGWRQCGVACVPCPTNGATFGCQADVCVATSCAVGYGPCAGACCKWRTETVTTSGALGTPVLAVDAGGTTYFAWQDSGKVVRYGKRTSGGTWSQETIESLTSAVYARQSVAIVANANGDAFVAYVDGSADLRLGERKKGVTGWTRSTIATRTMRAPSIGLDAVGTLHLVWGDDGGAGKLMHAVRPSGATSFTTETADAQSGAGYGTSMAPDASGRLFVAEIVWGSVKDGIALAQEGAAPPFTVDPVGTVTSSIDVSLALDAGGSPRVAWTDSDQSVLRLAKHVAAGWQVEDVLAGSVQESSAVAVALGEVHLAFSDSDGAVRHAFLSQGAWTSEVVSAGGTGISMLVDAGGRLRMRFRDGTSGAVRYAYFTPDP